MKALYDAQIRKLEVNVKPYVANEIKKVVWVALTHFDRFESRYQLMLI